MVETIDKLLYAVIAVGACIFIGLMANCMARVGYTPDCYCDSRKNLRTDKENYDSFDERTWKIIYNPSLGIWGEEEGEGNNSSV